MKPKTFTAALDQVEKQWRQERLADRTISGYARNLRRLDREVGGLYGESPQALKETLETWRDAEQDRFDADEIGASKIASDHCALVSFYRVLQTKGWIEWNPALQVQGMAVSQGKPRPISVEDQERICQAVDTTTGEGLQDRAVLEMMRHGLRQIEIISLKTSGVEYDDSKKSVWLTFASKGRAKKRVDRNLPMTAAGSDILALHMLRRFVPEKYAEWVRAARGTPHEKLMKALVQLLHQLRKEDGYLFVTTAGAPLHQRWVNRMFTKYRTAAGVDERFGPHTFRHRFCTSLLENNVDLRASMRLTGHRDIRSLMIYTDVARDRAAVDIEVIGSVPLRKVNV